MLQPSQCGKGQHASGATGAPALVPVHFRLHFRLAGDCAHGYIPGMEDFDIAAADAAQAIAGAQARAIEGDTLPMPPNNLPALRSIAGAGLMGASVLGYRIVSSRVHDVIAPDGNRKVPGDEGFLAAQYGRLGFAPMPKGWVVEHRQAHKLLAIVDGNPIMLEDQAKRLGYAHASASGPNTLDLGEIEA